MPNYIHHCPHCKSDETDIRSGVYFDIYKCSNCGEEYCLHCRDSNNARRCPECGDTEGHHDTVARVSQS